MTAPSTPPVPAGRPGPVAGDAGRPPGRPARSPRTRRVVAAGAVLGLVGAGALGLAAQAAGSPPPTVTLVAGPKTVEVFEGDGFADYGIHVVTGNRPVVVTVARKDLGSPFVARLTLGKGRSARTVTLPEGLAGPNGLTGFLQLTFRNKAGAVVARAEQDWAPGGGFFSGPVRYRPDAPDSSPYPGGFGGAFPTGLLFGQQKGWAAPTLSFGGPGPAAPLPLGTYTLTQTISPQWRSVLGVSAKDATASVTVKVVEQPPFPQGARTPAARSQAAVVSGLDASGRVGTDRAGTEQARQQRLAEVAAAADGKQASLSSDPGLQRVPERRPDLRSNPAFGVTVLTSDDFPPDPNAPIVPPNHDYLAFAATVWNDGSSPLVVEGSRASGADLMQARQYFYDSDGEQLGWAPVGSMQYDPKLGHQHWHFLDFAQYNLLGASKQQLVRSQKEAFCLAPTDAVNMLNPDANWQPGSIGLFSQCGQNTSIGIRENLDVGWGDTYGQFLPGQSFDITDLPNGTYYIQVRANPEKNLYETDTTNNDSLRKIVLGGKPGARTVKVPPYLGNDVP